MNHVKIVTDRVQEVLSGLRSLEKAEVLIGIPEETTDRSDDQGITNATIGYISEFGSPEKNIPARPFLIPGIQNCTGQVARVFKAGAEQTLDGQQNVAEKTLETAGMIAASSVKKKIQSGPFVPLSPDTIRNRKYNRGTKSRRASETAYLAMINEGANPAYAQSAAGINPLINTGQLRNSITYVVKNK